jgi:hypothetical protein
MARPNRSLGDDFKSLVDTVKGYATDSTTLVIAVAVLLALFYFQRNGFSFSSLGF